MQVVEYSKKGGQLTMNVTIKVDPDGLVGGDPTTYFSKFLTPRKVGRIIVINNVCIYVNKEVGLMFVKKL